MAILARRPPVVAAVLLSPFILAALLSFAGHHGALLAGVLMAGCFTGSIFLLCYRDPTTLVGFFIAFTILLPSDYTVGSLGAAGSPATVVGIAAFVWWGFSHLGSSEAIGRGRQPIRIGIFIFGASILLSYGAAFSRQISALEISGANRGLLELFGLAGIGLLISDGIPNRDRLDVLGRRLIFWVSVLAVLGIYQYVSGSTFVGFYAHVPGLTAAAGKVIPLGTRNGFLRVEATAGSPIEFGLVMAATLPIAVHYALYARRGRRAASWLAVALMAATIPLSGSRAGVVGLAAAAIVLLVGWKLPRRLGAIGVMVAFLALLRMAMPGRIGSLIGDLLNASSDPSVTHREQDLARSGFLLTRSIWFGRGFGTFIPSEFATAGQPIESLDNQYLGSLIETGIVGLLALILLLFIWLFTALGARRRARDECTRDLGLCLAASSAVLLVGFYVFDVFSFDISANVMFVLLGISGAAWRLAPLYNIPAEFESIALAILADG